MTKDTPHDLHRPLGDTSLTASPLGLDTVKFDHNQGVKYSSSLTIPDDRRATGLLALVRDLGINLIDTVPTYGRSEERLGPLLCGQHEHQVIISKVDGEFVDGQSVFDFSAMHTRRSVERSPKRLETERIELVLVRSDGNDLGVLENSEVCPTLAAFKREGLIGAYGLSDKTVEDGLRVLHEGDCVMVTYNLNERAKRPVIEYAAAHAKGILVRKVLASGHACLDAGQDPVRASFELVFDQSSVAAIIVGTVNPLHLAHDIAMAVQALKKA